MEEMPLSYTKKRIIRELTELGLSNSEINKFSFEGIKKSLPEEYGGPCKLFSGYYTDKNDKSHYICYCPKCKKLRFTTRCACMCGSCETCGYRWTCQAFFEEPSIKSFPKSLFAKLESVKWQWPTNPEDYSI